MILLLLFLLPLLLDLLKDHMERHPHFHITGLILFLIVVVGYLKFHVSEILAKANATPPFPWGSGELLYWLFCILYLWQWLKHSQLPLAEWLPFRVLIY